MTGPGPAARGRRPGGDRPDRPDQADRIAERPGARGPGGPREPFQPAYRIVELRGPEGPLRARVNPSVPDRRPGMTFASRSSRPPPGPVRRFLRAWGWRAYALPVLLVLSVLCGLDVANGAAGMPLLASGSAEAAPPAAGPPAPGPPTPAATASRPRPKPTPTGIFVDDNGQGTARALPPTALPAGAPYSTTGAGRFDVVPGGSEVSGTGPLLRYAVELEAGVAEDGPAFAAAVERILGDPRSWTAGGRAAFQRVDSGPVDFRVSLTASLTVRRLCGYELPYETSCYNGDLAKVVINHARWVRGAVVYAGKLPAYQQYVINHEVGHALGNGHQPCPRAGALAPLMMQQTLGIGTPGVGACRPNPWPYP